ncbi:2-hydroxy-3-oxopropionate reductase [Intrasporangium chromatireducens]|nr:2-hydroxy-3-oxopropionate reductase [Intrasporangium chromatireducens]
MWASSTSRRPRRRTAWPGCRATDAPPPADQPPWPATLTTKEIHDMSTIAFIGLGIMGSPMAVHLQNAGHDVVGYNRTPEKTQPLIAAGGRATQSIADAVSGADVVCVMVPDSPDVRDVLEGEGGVFANAKPNALVIDFSTIRPDVTVELAEQARERGLRLLDAPVSGGEAGAKNAALSIMVGGSDEDFEAARPVFEAVGKTVVHVGPSGSGQTVKAANQLIVAANIQALSEAVVFLEAYGVDTGAALEVLGGGLAGSKVLDQKKGNMLSRSFVPGFRIELHHKDLGIVTAAAREAGVAIPLGSLVAQLMASATAVGDGGLDHSALLRGVERLSGRERS